jgi:hypothetical protein
MRLQLPAQILAIKRMMLPKRSEEGGVHLE